MSFSFVWGGGALCPQTEMDYAPGRAYGVQLSPVGFADSHMQIWIKAIREK
jgi:hypothetical protein